MSALPFNNKAYGELLDIVITLESEKFVVTVLTIEFKGIIVGKFDSAKEAQKCCAWYGFNIDEYEVATGPFTSDKFKIV